MMVENVPLLSHHHDGLQDAWNKFDFTIVIIAFMTLILEAVQSPIPPALLRVIRSVRTVRLVSAPETLIHSYSENPKDTPHVVNTTLWHM